MTKDTKNSEMYQKYKQNMYYIIIGIVSFVALVFLPMLGSTVDMGFVLPKTTAAWVVFITTRICVSLVNVLIFHSFMEQGKLNISDNKDYLHANEILKNVKEARVKQAMAPNKWLAKEYSTKGVSLFISSMLATFAISQAILSYDWITLISYSLTIGSAVVFGVLQMKKAETYWTVEYPQYANDYEEAFKKREEEEKAREEAEKLAAEKAAQEEAERKEKEAKEAAERAVKEAEEAKIRAQKEAELEKKRKEEEEQARKIAEEQAKKQAEMEAKIAAIKAEYNFNMEEHLND